MALSRQSDMDGIYLIDKEPGMTSFAVCKRLRWKLSVKKVGHTGTLDRFATGLLLVATGRGTKLIPYFEKAKKTYRARIVLGKTSETLDPESSVVDTGFSGVPPSEEEILEILAERFAGKIMQTPPKYSALKIGGKRMSDLVRAGKEFEVEPRPAEVFRSEIVSYVFPELEVELEVAAGFYVRSFARDLGEALAGGGMCTELRRTAIENVSVDEAVKVDEANDPVEIEFLLERMPGREIPAERIQRLNSP